MRAVAELAEELNSEPALEPPDPRDASEVPGAGVRGMLRGLPGFEDFPPGAPLPGPGGVPPRTPLLPQGLQGVGGLPIGVQPPSTGWEKHFVRELIALVNKAKRREEDPTWSVRERLSARAGRLHVMRLAKRLARKLEVDGELDLPSSDEDLVLPKSKKRRKRRTRKDSSSDRDRDRRAAKKRKSRKAGSSSRSRSSSTDSLQPFRGAPSLGAASNRAQRDAQVRPHQVLVESLTQIVSSLPRSGEGAEVTRGDVFRRLPAVYRSWFDIKMAPVLRGTSGNQRSWREAKTLTTILDHLLTGNVLGSIMTLLGRLHAVTDVATNEGTSWALAQHHEIVPSDAVGLLTARSRANQAQDQRELLRTQGYMRGSGMPAAA